MRRDLDIDAGDVIMLKVLKIPKLYEFEQALNEAQEWAKDAKALYIVSSDADLLNLVNYEEIDIVIAKVFCERYLL